MKLFDARTNGYVLEIRQPTSFDQGSPSKYTHCSIHSNGYLIAAPCQYSSGISIHDLRFQNVENDMRPQVFTYHDKQVLSAQFWESRKGKNSLVSLSTDRSVVFADYQLG